MTIDIEKAKGVDLEAVRKALAALQREKQKQRERLLLGIEVKQRKTKQMPSAHNHSSIDRVYSDLIRNAHSFLWSESAMENKNVYQCQIIQQIIND